MLLSLGDGTKGHRPLDLPPWRIWVVTIAVSFTDAAIATMDEQFATLITGNLPGAVDGFGLSVVSGGTLCVASAPH